VDPQTLSALGASLSQELDHRGEQDKVPHVRARHALEPFV
jgi:hypothetical protein